MKKLYGRSVVVVALLVVLSLLISGVASAGERWNKWQPIEWTNVDGTFKFSDDTVLLIKEYTLVTTVIGDLVVYLTPYDSFEDFYYEVYTTECAPQGAIGHTNWGAAWWLEDLTGRGLGDLGFEYGDRLYSCNYEAGWHDAQP
jgi:hypothetical protein